MGFFDDPKFHQDGEDESEAKKWGRKSIDPSLAGFFTAMQGPTFGFADEIAGAAGAAAGGVASLFGKDDGQTLRERYRQVRDAVRGSQEQYEKDYPTTALTTKLAAAAPTIAFSGGAPAAAGVVRALPVGAGRSALEAVKYGGLFGAAQGVGESAAEDLGGMAQDALKSGAWSAGLGAATSGGVSAIGAVAGNVAQRLRPRSAGDFARLKIAEAIARDAQNSPVAIDEAANRFVGLGREARVADSAGESTLDLLDLVATIPGRTRQMARDAVTERQVGRFDRLASGADEALGTAGADVRGTLEMLDAQRKSRARPFYTALEKVTVPVDDELALLLRRAMPYDARVKLTSQTRTGTPLDIGAVKAGDALPFTALDTLKQSLDAASIGSRTPLGKATPETLDINDLRAALIDKLESATPQGLYQKARSAYAGPSALMDALEMGRLAMRDDSYSVATELRKFGDSEMQAFRIGALEALRQKAGTEGGQTSLLKYFKERNTSDRLRLIFGDNFGDFARALDAERQLKLMEGKVGGGAQTAKRLMGADDLGEHPMVDVARAATTNNLSGLLAGAGRAWNKVRTPEATRDEIGRLLLQQGPEGERVLNTLREYLDRINNARLGRGAAIGTAWGASLNESGF